MAKVRKHVVIKGRVQGVWFRASTQEEALLNDVTGWVRNTYDGNVEAVFEGEARNVDNVVKWCHHGPDYALVQKVEVDEEVYTGKFSTFSIEYTR